MQVRDELDSSYESAGWKVVYILMEPVGSNDEIDSDYELLKQLRVIDGSLAKNYDVVGGGGEETPSYEGPYNVLYDAVDKTQIRKIWYGCDWR